MSQQLVNKLLSVDGRNYSDEELMAKDRKTLNQIATYNGEATKTTPELQMMIAAKPILPGDSMAAARIFSSAEYRSTAHVRPGAFIQTHGGMNFFAPTKIVMTELNGKKHERENVPIPLPFGKRAVYANVQPLAALCAQLVRNNQGKWESAISTVAWNKIFKSGVNVVGMQAVARAVVEILSDNAYWKSLELVQKNSIQGPELLTFVVSTLNALPPVAYWALNCQVVFNGLRVMEKIDGEWNYCLDDNGERIVDPKVWSVVRAPEIKAHFQGKFPAVVQYNGGLEIAVNFPQSDGTFASARAAQARLREVQGSDDACTAILAGMRGFSGLTDSFEKKMDFLVSSVIAMWKRGRAVDVQLSTVGDLSMLISSLNKWKRLIYARDVEVLEMFPSLTEEEAKQKYKCEVKFLLPKATDKSKVPAILHPVVSVKLTQGAVFVAYQENQLPTADKKGAKVDYDMYSKVIIPDTVESNDYLLYTAIFGDYPFRNDEGVKRNRAQTMQEALKEVNTKDPIVYQFGIASAFRGILSSVSNLTLVGYGHPPRLKGFDMNVVRLHDLPLQRVVSQAHWYGSVSDDCATQSTMFLAPVVRYSGISNLLSQSKEAAVMQLRIVPMESGLALSLVVNRVMPVKSAKVVFDDDGEPPNQDTQNTQTTPTVLSSQEKVPRIVFDDSEVVLPSSSSSTIETDLFIERPLEEDVEDLQKDVVRKPKADKGPDDM